MKRNQPAPPPSEILLTERLQLRMLTPEFYAALFASCDDARICAVLGLPDEASLDKEKRRQAAGRTMFNRSFRNFLLIRKDSGKVIGACGFHTWYTDHRRAEIGYSMYTEDEKGKGYMTEAMAAVLHHGFHEMALHRVEAMVAPWNVPSVRLLRRFGFREEGLLRGHYQHMGGMEDSAVYGLLRADWQD